MHKLALPIFLFFFTIASFAQDEAANYYWVQFSDKNGTNYSIDKPHEFLSDRALNRRQKQNISITENDLPVSQVYLDALKSKGAEIVHTSKWLNGATIGATKSVYEELLASSDFIQFSELTKPGLVLKSTRNKFKVENKLDEINPANYGQSIHQIELFNGQFLHQQGFLGEGIQVAVLDAGFSKADELPAFEAMHAENRLLGTRDFVSPGSHVFQHDEHGTNVLSAMAGEMPGQLIGTAPKASYYLFRTEDSFTEFLIEEDNWVAAAEYADSLGCDIINSSLGYAVFDDADMDHTYADMDGKTTRVSRAANFAVQKGMLVFSSAGNEAAEPWKYLVAPSDGDLVIGVGAVDKDSIWAPFSSFGPTSDGDVKPNLSALGWRSAVLRENGNVVTLSGTSFSAPILAGMAACLWQASPLASSLGIKDALERSASQFGHPDEKLGYGIPDFKLANLLLSGPQPPLSAEVWFAAPNPFQDYIYFYQTERETFEKITLSLFSLNGSRILSREFYQGNSIFISNLANLPSGLILAKIESGTTSAFIKLVKINP
jgi:subtilisin family serine protease